MSSITAYGASFLPCSCSYSQHYIFLQGLMCLHHVSEISHFGHGFEQNVKSHFLQNFFVYFPFCPRHSYNFPPYPYFKSIKVFFYPSSGHLFWQTCLRVRRSKRGSTACGRRWCDTCISDKVSNMIRESHGSWGVSEMCLLKLVGLTGENGKHFLLLNNTHKPPHIQSFYSQNIYSPQDSVLKYP